MPAVAVGDVFLVTLNGLYLSQRIMLTHHYVVTAADGVSDEADFADAILGLIKSEGDVDIETAWAECLPSGFSVTQLWAQKIRLGRYRRREIAGEEVGTLTASEVTTVAASLTLQTAASGRNQQSVKKIGPLPTTVDYVNNGVLTNTMIAALSLLGNALSDELTLPFSAGILKPCIYHGEAPFPAPDIITAFVIPETARSNGRRVVGRGV